MAAEPDQFPPVIQIIIWAGGVASAVLVWLTGARGQHRGDDVEVDELRRELDRERHKSDIARLRIDMEMVIGATREAVLNAIRRLEDKIDHHRKGADQQSVALDEAIRESTREIERMLLTQGHAEPRKHGV